MGNDQEINSSNTERIVRLETLVESQTSFLQRIESKLDMLSEKYVTRELFNQVTENIHNQVSEIKEAKKNHKNTLPMWVAIIPSIILVVIEIINLAHK
jgi:predicted DNA-binding protein YlxM (UPF0122 family)